ncbi:KEOPS complex subunit Pcc1 [Halarchaeum solikamskense]|uniref:KEOPS complex subunit Pcc1 n=1 Tax=Halarchaeum nitratireducens TaxID=489913 RepID=UPI001B3B03E9|nr:KEOPS complex subunit Pcc1 [Halarchaeum solikamskense]MBP2251604.1 KEOPS complex subunit Pcc1 [Halarchaeum solikamskense]
MHRTSLVFSYETERVAAAVADAVRVEAGDIESERTRASVERDGETVRVAVTAADLTALRAGTNTWTTLVAVAERANEAGRTHAALRR